MSIHSVNLQTDTYSFHQMKNGVALETLKKNGSPLIGEQAEEKKAQTTVSSKLLEEQVEGINTLLDSSAKSIKFQIHEKLDRVYVQVINNDTDELVREIPPEEFLDMVAAMLEFAGFIVDKRI